MRTWIIEDDCEAKNGRVDVRAVSAVVAVLRVVTDTRITAALRDLADALEAHGGARRTERAQPIEPGDAIIVDPPEVTDEHPRYVERRLRKARVLR